MASSRWFFFGWPALLRAGAVSAGVLLLAGCSGAPAAEPSPPGPSASSPASSSPSPTPTAAASPKYRPADAKGPAQNVPLPVKPPLADEKSKQGLEAFARYWYSVFGYAYESGDFVPLADITGANCAPCNRAKSVVESWYSKGGWTAGGRFDVAGAQSRFAETSAGGYQVIVQTRQHALLYYRHNGTLDESNPQSEYITDIMVAQYSTGRWHAELVEHVRGG
ncbi:DUF6318 family protein [Paenarthrobacter sp. DKR-5]|uniref:DUF6318 family protein n=1 Tax=Paenarthrobacter sp. DKR-5 TaxID=2835535 RepID=UPI0027DBB257|nr:DUF6318 family protein [Paenarthrobacter sp. DKR-5]